MASRARPRWRSCLESTHQPRRDWCEPPPDGAPGPWRELHCRPPGLGGSCTADPQPARLPTAPFQLHHAYCTFPRLPILAQPPSCPALLVISGFWDF
jgi:hypothetical protein